LVTVTQAGNPMRRPPSMPAEVKWIQRKAAPAQRASASP
jgi:hypothetical protein